LPTKSAFNDGASEAKKKRRLKNNSNNSIDDADGPLDLLIKKEQEEIFMNLIHQLPLPQRSALLLYFVEDFSLEEIASITGAQVGTVKSRMH
jgi:RNA polymerase sigma-70 factor (ECF subfamily)